MFAMKRLICAISLFVLGYWPLPLRAENELFPFVISFDAPKNVTNISHKLDAPAGKNGFVRVEGGHFVTDAGRIQFWGTNTCFAANFLTHEQADRVADRLARFGINCVRLHHLDARDIWGKNFNRTKMEFDPEQLDRLDYYVAALKKRGIYVNINLHVSRSLDERDGFPKDENRPSHDKGIDNFYRPFIDANKKYAKDLLEHVNPYTGNAYKDEPAVAMIEINNENSVVCMWGGWGGLDVIQDPFLADLQKLWNGWLKEKYVDDSALKSAWRSKDEPLGEEMLHSGDFTAGNKPHWQGWSWEVDDTVDAPLLIDNGVLKLDVRKKGNVSWLPQLTGSGFGVKKGQIYTLTFRAKAGKAMPQERAEDGGAKAQYAISIGVRMNHAPWQGLGFDTQTQLTADWQDVSLTFIPSTDDDNARLAVSGLQEGTVYEFDYFSLKPGGTIGLTSAKPGEETELMLNNAVPLIWKKDVGQYTKEAVDDFCDFLMDIEAKYWDEMRTFLKDEIKVRQPVSGTQLMYGSSYAQAKMDYCDVHAYWNHPSFPGRPWDGNNWHLRNRALVNHADTNIFGPLATSRVYGKPFTLSEYNHPYPNSYAAEGLPLIAAFGAFQGWDGIFPFAYSHSNDPEPQRATSFFDTSGNTVQMAHMIACHVLFCENYNRNADKEMIVAPMSAEKEREIFKEKRHVYAFDFSGLGLDRRLALQKPVAVDVSGKIKTMPAVAEIAKDCKVFHSVGGINDTWLDYDVTRPGKGFVSSTSTRAQLFTGFVEEGKEYSFPYDGDATLRFGKTNLGWATVSLAVVEVNEKKESALLVATGEMLNTDMKIEELGDGKITVGNRWGKAPVRCEGIPVTITFNEVPPVNVTIKCWSLDESGNRKQEVPVKKTDKVIEIELKPEYRTIWYELEVAQ